MKKPILLPVLFAAHKRRLLPVLFAAVLGGARPAFATQYSCLSIITESKQLGKWPALKAWIDAAGLADEWGKCQYVSDDYPQFAAITNALVMSGVLTDSETRQILSKSVDTAIPDALLRRIYGNDVKTSSGRTKWHGKLIRQVIDTNAWTRVSVYEDGTRFTDRATPPRSSTHSSVTMTNGVPARLAAARRRAAANAAATSNVTVTVRAGQ